MALDVVRYRDRMPLRFVSVFTGIGGMDLGLERAGYRCAAQVEIYPHAIGVLRRHWPRVPKFKDVRTFNRSCVHGRVDLIAGGFPCTDISNAGKQAGITGPQSSLWKEMLRIIQAFDAPLALIENVAVLRRRGLDTVLSDLDASGFNAEWDCLPAAAFGAPHLRDRIFIVAYAKRLGWPFPGIFSTSATPELRRWPSSQPGRFVEARGRARRAYPRRLRVGDGASAWMDRIRGCGNAVVPQVAEWIGRRLQIAVKANGLR